MAQKRLKLVAAIALLVFLGSCSKEERTSLPPNLTTEEGLFSAWISSVTPLSGVVAGKPAKFSTTYSKPSPCYAKAAIKTRMTGFEVELLVLLHIPRPPMVCSDVLVGETSQFQVLFQRAGTYTMTYKGTNGPESIQLTVN